MKHTHNKHSRRSLWFKVGNLLIAVSLLSTLSIIYPLIKEELTYRYSTYQPVDVTSDSFSISIPAIKLNSHISPNIDPWNKNKYSNALKFGAAHAQGTSMPGEEGSIFIFAHSSGNPWEQTYNNTPFYRLNKLIKNNIITLNYDGTSYTYLVTNLLEVAPSEVKYVLEQSTDQLILQTCTPIGTDWKRLLVFASPI